MTNDGIQNRWASRAGRKAPINRTQSKRFALATEAIDHAAAFGVRASSAPLSQGRLQFDGRVGSWKASCFVALLILLTVSQFSSTALASTFTASLDRSTIGVNESATLLLKFEGGLPADVPAAPNVPGLSIASIGQSSQFNFINGQSSSILSYNFLVRAAQPGDYTIPALSAMVDGKTLTSQ